MKKTIILGVAGSIAAYRACDIINGLKAGNFEVIPVVTKEATSFITPLSLSVLSGNETIEELFSPSHEWKPKHISLAERADLILIAPATANIIGKLACGLCDDILTSVVISSTCPILICPAMNEKMYNNKIVQRNISTLKELGYRFLGPIEGHLACGGEGLGHIATTPSIIDKVKTLLK